MKEANWLSGATPQQMLRYLKGKGSERKLRLFAIAVHREYNRIEPGFANEASLRATEKAEEIAEKGTSVDNATWHKMGGYFILNPTAFGAAKRLADNSDVPDKFKCDLLRCLFGNPFQPPVPDASWQSPKVIAMATRIYAKRAFDQMQILADALKKAGCADKGMLDHCRHPAPHARGCWVIDLLLGNV